MYMVRNYKELGYENREVLSCHFHLHNPYNCVRVIEQLWSRWCESAPWLNVRYFVPVLFFTVPMGYPIGKSSVVSTPLWTQCRAGEDVMSSKGSTSTREAADFFPLSNNMKSLPWRRRPRPPEPRSTADTRPGT